MNPIPFIYYLLSSLQEEATLPPAREEILSIRQKINNETGVHKRSSIEFYEIQKYGRKSWLSVEQWDKDTLLETTARRVPMAVSIKLIFKNQWKILAGPPLLHCFCLASRCSKKYVPWVPSVKQYHFVGSKGHVFSVLCSICPME